MHGKLNLRITLLSIAALSILGYSYSRTADLIRGPQILAKPRAILAKEDAGHAVAKEIEDEDDVEEDENDLATPRETEER